MNNEEHDHERTRALVIRAHADSRTTYEIVHQLSELLPIESLDDFIRDARLSVAGEELRVEELRPWLTEELFPVRDQEELVEKTAAAVRVAGHILRRKKPRNPSAAHRQLVQELAGDDPQIGVGILRGPSVFGVREGRS
jgi:hypothetical protein